MQECAFLINGLTIEVVNEIDGRSENIVTKMDYYLSVNI